MEDNQPVRVVRMAGDGIGPEVMDATCRVLEAAGARITWIDALLGRAGYDVCGDTLPPATIELLREHRYGLKGPTETIQGGGLRSANVRMREQLELYAGFRPARTFAGIADARPGVNIIVWREGTEGLYAARETVDRTARSATTTGVFTYDAMARLVRRACVYMRHHGLTDLVHVGKSNIMKETYGLYEQAARDVVADFPGIKLTLMNFDAFLMEMVRFPGRHRVVVCENFMGDGLSEMCAGLVGGPGLVGGANYGDNRRAVFEAMHGTAPLIAGQGIANPTALILSGIMLLDHIGQAEQARRVEAALLRTFELGIGTGDLVGPTKRVNTAAFADALIEQFPLI